MLQRERKEGILLFLEKEVRISMGKTLNLPQTIPSSLSPLKEPTKTQAIKKKKKKSKWSFMNGHANGMKLSILVG